MNPQHRSTGKRRPSRRRLAGILRRDQRPHSAHGTTRSISSRNTRLRVRFPDNSNPLARLSGFRMHPHPHHQMPAQLPTPRMPFTPGFADAKLIAHHGPSVMNTRQPCSEAVDELKRGPMNSRRFVPG